jgi:HlyD family secretion protein
MGRNARFAIAAAALAAIIGLWLLVRSGSEPEGWQGYVDADYVKVAPTQAGLLTSVVVARGDVVEAGALLFVQDETPDRASRDEAAHQLDEARQRLANLESGGKSTEIAQAEANLSDAKATLAQAETDYRRGQSLLPHRAVSLQSVQRLGAAQQSAEARVHAMEAALAQLEGPLGRQDEIKAQHFAVDSAKAALDLAQWRLDQRRVAAPAGGRIADVLARPGETMAAGAPVVSLLPPGNILVRFFVPEPALGGIHRGDRVGLACDSCPADLIATVSFISPQAEYTPPVIYSESSKSKLVYLVEAKPTPDRATKLNPGEPVEVRRLSPQAPG